MQPFAAVHNKMYRVLHTLQLLLGNWKTGLEYLRELWDPKYSAYINFFSLSTFVFIPDTPNYILRLFAPIGTQL
jgi:hypothetical protein